MACMAKAKDTVQLKEKRGGAGLRYILFTGKRQGLRLLKLMIEKGLKPAFVFAEEEHSHEKERHFEAIISLCEAQAIPFTANLDATTQKSILEKTPADYILVYGYRRLISAEIYQQVRGGAFGMHYALLPAYRGFAPVNWAIINGEEKTGVSLFCLGEEMDSGDIIEQCEVPIRNDDDINTVMARCDDAAMEIFGRQLACFEQGHVARAPQDHEKATYTCARCPGDGCIDWRMPTRSIFNLIRGLTHPFPGAYTHYNGSRYTVLNAEAFDAGNYVGRVPGRIVRVLKGLGTVVLTGDGALLVRSIADASGNVFTADQKLTSVRGTLGMAAEERAPHTNGKE